MDSETTIQFIEKIIKEKKQDLLSVRMDILFHQLQKQKLGNEDKLRKSLAKEKDKDPQKRNREVLETLEDKINNLNIINKKLSELISIEPQILEYVEYLQKNKSKIEKMGLDI